MAFHPNIDLTMYFCSRETLDGTYLLQEYGVQRKEWGEELLGGYKYKFLKNFLPIMCRTKLFKYLNLGIWKEIKNGDYHAVIITDWADLTYFITAIACKLFKTPFLFAADSTILIEKTRPRWKRAIKKFVLGKFLFQMASGFLCLSKLNRDFYRYYGVSEEKLFFYPQPVNYEKYFNLYCQLREQRESLRKEIGIFPDTFTIIFVGRLVENKRPLDLLKAYKILKLENKALIIVGDGKLKQMLQRYVDQHCLKGVYFVGFKPKSEVLKFYSLSDLLVLPSSIEPQGAVVAEAMCFGLPVIVSNRVGFSEDIVKHGVNGFIYPCGNINMLALYIEKLFDKNKRKRFGEKSLQIISNWGPDKTINGLIEALDFIYGRMKR